MVRKLTKELGPDYSKIKFYKGKGCDDCGQKGYLGRVGVYEVLPVTQKLKDTIIQKPTTDELLKVALDEGMITMLQDGVDKVSAGLTTIEEVLRVASEE
jgi:type II secretory ATPase GspE/PulE/Tfp pilus assembly ATPase PilB-like protein